MQNVFANTLPYATTYGLKLEAYEGGVDTHGPFNIGAKKAASLDPAIEALMGRYLNAWYSQGGDVLNWYRLGAQTYNTTGGTFGITDSSTTSTSRRRTSSERTEGSTDANAEC